MKKLLIAGLLAAAAAAGSWAQTPALQTLTDKAKAKLEMATCNKCGEEIEFRYIEGRPTPIHPNGWCSGC